MNNFFFFQPSLRTQSGYFVSCKLNLKLVKNRLVAESAILLTFFDFLGCLGFHEQVATVVYKRIVNKYIYRKIIIRNMKEESANCKPNPQNVSGIRMHLRTPLTMCGIPSHFVDSAVKVMCQQKLG